MRLAVNIDHIATLREARKAREPEPVAAAIAAEMAGAQGITVHLRSDRRHIKDRDLELLRQTIATKLNVEMAVTSEMARVERRLAGEGRLLVRYSGTEPLLRVMIEGKDQQQIQAWAAEIAGAVREQLG